MTDKTNTHALPAWTEVEYTALCKNPYLLTPFFILRRRSASRAAKMARGKKKEWFSSFSNLLQPLLMPNGR